MIATDPRREDTRIRILTEDGKAIIDIHCGFGIDRTTIRRKAAKWPAKMFVRLHLRGLESFQASNGEETVRWSVSSTGRHAKRIALRRGATETPLDSKSPYYSTVSIVGGKGKLPLQNGHFNVPLPEKLFAENPESIVLSWIDFYRN